ncbi:glycosyltransferase family 2 protein [Novosphingobium sp. KCTC 2891]|uniref:glycosyltransferase family 2 protein n=1 Tax=Novosphingobium sp. KCTC 2891 TaxID=2989730 RepID=UPI002222F963|nr:glycosyltransferase family A protein [Novosphingobium sp. KCTC 2891]MCW1382711.1 glycosyltransferase family 2 protein [Novosphingobium sp. KCTC 2891]
MPGDRTDSPDVSVVVSSLGRTEELARLLDSLERQSFSDFEVILVDQNSDDRLAPISAAPRGFALHRLRMPGRRGVSCGRNAGWRQARGRTVIFPDDDCWYPPEYLETGVRLLDETGAQLLSGRCSNTDGRSINARFAKSAGPITRGNVWISQMEGMTFVRRSLLEELEGYDEGLGIGSPTPWQAAEGPDFILRALARGRRCHFDPRLYGYHLEIDTSRPDNAMFVKIRAYARGMGYVLRRHGYRQNAIAYWAGRSLFNAVRYALLHPRRARLAWVVAMGRIEGYRAGTPLTR